MLISDWSSDVCPSYLGVLETRPGSRFIGDVKNSAKTARVLPFQVTEALGYLVVANGGVFQFVYRGAFVLSGGNRVEVAHPYADAELPQLRFTQSADTRSEESRVGQEGVSTCRARWLPYYKTKKKTNI